MAMISRRPASPASHDAAGPLVDPALGLVEAELFAAGIRGARFEAASDLFAAATAVDRLQMLDAIAATPGDRVDLSGASGSSATDSLPLLVRAWHTVAWVQRTGTASGADALAAAEADLIEASRRDPNDPIPWIGLTTTGRLLGIPVEERVLRFAHADALHPGLLDAHIEHLRAVAPAAGGTAELLSDAADQGASAAVGSPLHALVPMAQIIHLVTSDEQPSDYFDTDRTTAITDAAEASVLRPDFGEGHARREVVHAWNIFAMGLVLCEEMTAAASLFSHIGDTLVTPIPWGLHGDDIVDRYIHVRRVNRQARRDGVTGSLDLET